MSPGSAGRTGCWHILDTVRGADKPGHPQAHEIKQLAETAASKTEKLGFGLPVLALAALGRVGPSVVAAALPDLILGALFAVAWVRTRPSA